MAWKNGKRVGFGSREYSDSTRWIRLATPGYMIYSDRRRFPSDLDISRRRLGLGHFRQRRGGIEQPCKRKTPVTITE